MDPIAYILRAELLLLGRISSESTPLTPLTTIDFPVGETKAAFNWATFCESKLKCLYY